MEDTDGTPLDYEQIELPKLLLVDCAEKWGVSVRAVPGNYSCYGYFSSKRKEIGLATSDEVNFFHEWAHCGHEKVVGILTLGQDPFQEIVAELFNHRLDYLQLTRSSEYYRDNKRLCKKILKVWENISVSDVTKKKVSDLILAEVKRCRKEGLTNSRPNKLFAALSATFNHASKHLGLDLKNPCNGLSKLPEDRQIQFIPSEEMISAVKEACNLEPVTKDFGYMSKCTCSYE